MSKNWNFKLTKKRHNNQNHKEDRHGINGRPKFEDCESGDELPLHADTKEKEFTFDALPECILRRCRKPTYIDYLRGL